MWTALTSYIWGDESDEQIVPGLPLKVEDTRADDDWVLVDVNNGKLRYIILNCPKETRKRYPKHEVYGIFSNFRSGEPFARIAYCPVAASLHHIS